MYHQPADKQTDKQTYSHNFFALSNIFLTFLSYIPMPAVFNFSWFEFLFFQKTGEAAARRERLAELEECKQISDQVELEMASVKFFVEWGKGEADKLEAADMKNLLKAMRKTLEGAKKCGDLADTAKDKLDFQ